VPLDAAPDWGRSGIWGSGQNWDVKKYRNQRPGFSGMGKNFLELQFRMYFFKSFPEAVGQFFPPRKSSEMALLFL